MLGALRRPVRHDDGENKKGSRDLVSRSYRPGSEWEDMNTPARPTSASPPSGSILVPIGNAQRRLLAGVRDVMALAGTGQQQLDHIVHLVATEMQAEVCSCYVLRPGDVLELFATIGLNPAAVHTTRLRVGEGVIGDIAAHARPLALADARRHPGFAFRPETGEDPFLSLMGVPVLRSGRVRGVLAIQHRCCRTYSEEEVETLQTIAMIVAELISGGTLIGSQEMSSVGDAALLPSRLEGISLNSGIAMGLAILHRQQLSFREMVADDPEHELDRLREAVTGMHSAIDALVAAAASDVEPRDILEAYRMIAEDGGWLTRISDAIETGLTAEAAVQRVQNDTRARMGQIADPYIRERLLDLDDLSYRLLRHLCGGRSAADGVALPDDFILVARSLGPAELLDYDRTRLRGLILEEGSASSHVVIIARAFDIPVVGQCHGALARIDLFDPVVVDGVNGQIFVRPGEDIQAAVTESMRLIAMAEKLYAEATSLPSVTKDKIAVSIQLNCGLLIDVPHVHDSGADGIGLYRTEIPFMVHSNYPDVATQTELYSRVFEHAAGKPVVFRTLDVGGDKRLPYFATEAEDNPALGWRSIRISLDRPAMLRQQLRALLRAAAGRPLAVMFPMIAEIAEFDAVRRLVDMELARASVDGIALPATLRLGVMVEVPALFWQLPALLPRVDFLSVGSNDLAQYLFAYDRTNHRLADRYDSLSPPMLNALRFLVEQCDAASVPVSICGEMAGRPLDAMALLGIGFRRLSMAPPAVGPVKRMLRSLEVGQVRDFLAVICCQGEHSLRGRLKAFALDHGIEL
ncbi:phosphotransferase system, enzyme I, PtsP [uncultured Gammaproteobacteria bacterium]